MQIINKKYLDHIKLQYFNLECVHILYDLKFPRYGYDSHIMSLRIEDILPNKSVSQYHIVSPVITRNIWNPNFGTALDSIHDPIFAEMLLEAELKMMGRIKDLIDTVTQVCKLQVFDSIIDDFNVNKIHTL